MFDHIKRRSLNPDMNDEDKNTVYSRYWFTSSCSMTKFTFRNEWISESTILLPVVLLEGQGGRESTYKISCKSKILKLGTFYNQAAICIFSIALEGELSSLGSFLK
jgi:hypothetical protein